MIKFFSKYKIIFYFINFSLIFLYLFPGSLIGFFLYGDLGKQPKLISNPFGNSINHLIFFFYLSILGFITQIQHKKIIFSFTFLFCVSIIFELLHLIIPNRAFELNDLFANFIGVVLAFLIFKLIIKLKN